ncbi:hypothetical protein BDN72DRAFT_893672 [Pluteus cervinus]|uniref:Uncharacterized protein n=1 Tax=Pluteus cervinus TaxID=181527 RepID=A0ACD3B7P2_9AGAR|nr:hypothetical protein BDN72DRAFT_893672 [Pluteus cervinus]
MAARASAASQPSNNNNASNIQGRGNPVLAVPKNSLSNTATDRYYYGTTYNGSYYQNNGVHNRAEAGGSISIEHQAYIQATQAESGGVNLSRTKSYRSVPTSAPSAQQQAQHYTQQHPPSSVHAHSGHPYVYLSPQTHVMPHPDFYPYVLHGHGGHYHSHFPGTPGNQLSIPRSTYAYIHPQPFPFPHPHPQHQPPYAQPHVHHQPPAPAREYQMREPHMYRSRSEAGTPSPFPEQTDSYGSHPVPGVPQSDSPNENEEKMSRGASAGITQYTDSSAGPKKQQNWNRSNFNIVGREVVVGSITSIDTISTSHTIEKNDNDCHQTKSNVAAPDESHSTNQESSSGSIPVENTTTASSRSIPVKSPSPHHTLPSHSTSPRLNSSSFPSNSPGHVAANSQFTDHDNSEAAPIANAAPGIQPESHRMPSGLPYPGDSHSLQPGSQNALPPPESATGRRHPAESHSPFSRSPSAVDKLIDRKGSSDGRVECQAIEAEQETTRSLIIALLAMAVLASDGDET